MKSFSVGILFFLIFLNLTGASAQTFRQDFSAVLENLKAGKHSHSRDALREASVRQPTVSEIKLFLLGSVKLYQTVISSQDMSVCNFTPSCSHFSVQALQKAGFLKGLLLTSDRLQRCNGFASFSHMYKYDPEKEKYIDPVERYLSSKKGKK